MVDQLSCSGQWVCLVEGQQGVVEVKGHLGETEGRGDVVDMEGNGHRVPVQPSEEGTKAQVSQMVAVGTTWKG